MAEDNEQDEEQKTESPTERKLEQAREQGQAPVSKEITNWFFILTSCFILLVVLPRTAHNLINVMKPFLSIPDQMIVQEYSLKILAKHLFSQIAPLGTSVHDIFSCADWCRVHANWKKYFSFIIGT